MKFVGKFVDQEFIEFDQFFGIVQVEAICEWGQRSYDGLNAAPLAFFHQFLEILTQIRQIAAMQNIN